MIRLYLIEDYKDRYPDLKGGALSERMILNILEREGVEDPVILRTENGKPYEKDASCFFSLSHSLSFFACAVAAHEIGLDIEAKTPKDPYAIAERFFTPEEAEFLDRTERADTTAFRRIWTRKEALLKYRGATLSDIMDRESVLERSDVDLIDMELPRDIIGCLCIPPGEDRDVEMICEISGDQ